MCGYEIARNILTNILICLYVAHLVGVSEMWIKNDSSYFGLWIYCNKSPEYDCCQRPLTLSLESTAWLHASRTFIMFGVIGGLAVIIMLHVIDDWSKNGKEWIFKLGILNILTALCIFIGTGVFHGFYKKEYLLQEFQPFACLYISYGNGGVYFLLGLFSVIYVIIAHAFPSRVSTEPVHPDTSREPVHPDTSREPVHPDTSREPVHPDTSRGQSKNKKMWLCPSYWRTSKLGKYVHTFKRFEVDGRTFKAIDGLVQRSWIHGRTDIGRDAQNLHHRRLIVKKVERIENVNLYKFYSRRRREIEKSQRVRSIEKIEANLNSSPIFTTEVIEQLMLTDIRTDLNECYLFHGTKETNEKNIMKNGLDPRNGSNDAMFGRGTYAAERSSKADQYTDEKTDRRKEGLKMFLIRMLLGNIYVAKEGHKIFTKPPCIDCCCDRKYPPSATEMEKSQNCVNAEHERFNSVVADNEDKWRFREFIVYDIHQSYPEYIITYDRQ